MLKKGYSLIVLIIAISVILIITSVAIVTLKDNDEETAITEFIFNIDTCEDFIREYYAENGVLPILDVFDTSSLTDDFWRGANKNDNDVYYRLDMNKIGNIHLYECAGDFFFNENSLTVYNSSGVMFNNVRYYTTSNELMGQSNYYKPFDIVINNNPIAWSKDAKIKVDIQNMSNMGEAAVWTFKWDRGAKNKSYFDANGYSFNYGDILVIPDNGVYTIYVSSYNSATSQQYTMVKSVVVSKIDEIAPTYTIDNANSKIIMDDAETGISEVHYKVKTNQITDLTSYLVGGKGDTVQEYKADLDEYTLDRNSIETLIESIRLTQEEYAALTATQQANYDAQMEEYQTQLDDLDDEYNYLSCYNKYVVYVEDFANNEIISETISATIMSNTFGGNDFLLPDLYE